MTNNEKIDAWLWHNRMQTWKIAKAAVEPLLLASDGSMIGDEDFPSGADYIDHVHSAIVATGLYEHATETKP